MRRYTSLLLTAFTLFLIVLAGSTYLARADRAGRDTSLQQLNVYTTLPNETASLLAEEYRVSNQISVNFLPLSAAEILSRLREPENAGEVAMLLADSDVLRQAAAEGLLVPHISERGDSVPEGFKDAYGYWVGVWYDPMVFAANRDYLQTLPYVPDSWALLAAYPDVRLGITDFIAADASANLLYSLIAQYGDAAAYDLLRQMHPKILQYAKYLSTPVRMAGMGEVDVAVAVQSETLRYLNDGYPLHIIYPADGTAYMLTGAAAVGGATETDVAAACAFMDWLLTDEAQQALQKNGFYFAPTNPATLAYKSIAGKNMVLFSQPPRFTPAQQHDFLDRWVKYIRFK